MWLYIAIAALAILCIAGGVLLGGVFTIVLVPLAVLVGISAFLYALWGASSRVGEGAETGSGSARGPLPHSHPDGGRVRTTPERLADARRVEQ